MRKFVYVYHMGAVWRLTIKNYKKLLEAIAQRKDYDLEKFGRCLYPVEIIDWMLPDDAWDILEDWKD